MATTKLYHVYGTMAKKKSPFVIVFHQWCQKPLQKSHNKDNAAHLPNLLNSIEIDLLN